MSQPASQSVSQSVSQLAKERQLIQKEEIMIKYSRHNIDREHRGNIIIHALLCMKEVMLEMKSVTVKC